MHNPMTSQAIISYFWSSQTFSIFTQYMSVSHGHSTIGGKEWWLWRREKEEDSLTSTRRINRLWRWSLIGINVSSRDCDATDALRAISVWTLKLKTKWVCIQLVCSRRPWAFEEPHNQNIQDKFYNEKFPLVIWKWLHRRLPIWKTWF